MLLLGTEIHSKLEILTCDTLIYTVNHPRLIVSNQMVESISLQRAKCILSSDKSPDIFGTRQLSETSANQTVEDSTSNRVVSASSSEQDNYKHHQSQHMETGDHVCMQKYEPPHEISNNVVCATSKGSDQPAHASSLIRAFASRTEY